MYANGKGVTSRANFPSTQPATRPSRKPAFDYIGKTLDGYITSWNKGAETIFGFKNDEAVGKHISLIIPTDRMSEEQTILSKIRSGDSVEHYETVRRRKDGRG